MPSDRPTVRAYYCDHFVLPLPDGHRFPMEKYRLLRERFADSSDVALLVPEAVTNEELGRVHTSGYLEAVVSGDLEREEVRRIGFPWSLELVERSRRSAGGTLAASRAALTDGASANLAGGTHHAFADRGEGFCVFNDVAVAIRAHQAERTAERFGVLDLDVHQGNGTARIFTGDPSVFTCSVHGRNNYPFRKEVSDLDLELEDGADDDSFLAAVATGLDRVLASDPDLIFFVAGADPFQGDKLGRLGVSKAALAVRDETVFSHCAQHGVPVAVVMSGGYAESVSDTVDIHEVTVRTAARHAKPGNFA